MTETDATVKPLEMPVKFLPYLEKFRIYKLFKDMTRDLVINLPKDHLKHMKIYLANREHKSKDNDRIIVLVSPELKFDRRLLAKELLRDLGLFVVTRRCILDRYDQHHDFNPDCISPVLLAQVAKKMVMKDPIVHDGWLMFDHPCTLREARCLQQEGVLPTVTLALMPIPPVVPPAPNPLTPARGFFDQDYEGLKFAFKATLKEVHVDPEDTIDTISQKCFNAVRASAAGAQGAGQGLHAGEAPGVYRVVLAGPRGSGRRTQAAMLAKHFNLVYLHFDDLYAEAIELKDELSEKIIKCGTTVQMKAQIVNRRLLKKDCIDHGWVLVGFPQSGHEFDLLDNMETPPNRIIFLNADVDVCKRRDMARAVNWCTGLSEPMGSGPRVKQHPKDESAQLDQELDLYFSEAVAEMRAAAGITAWEIDANQNIDYVQTKIQAAVIAAPAFDIEYSSQLKGVCGD